jgi:acyl-homoserine-lactone acylase
MDGSRPDCQWGTDPDAPVPGIFGPSHLPKLERQDWVANSNDSYWLTNPAQPLTGYARIIGNEGTPRSLRTRQGILQIQHRLDGSDGLGGPDLFDVSNLEEIVLSAHIYSGDLGQSAVLSDLCPTAGIYDTSAACNAIGQWDRAATLTSIGLPVWKQFWNNLVGLSVNYWLTPFDVNDPVNTPRGLNTSLPEVREALYNAQTLIQDAGLPFDAPLGQQQHSGVNDPTIPIFGEGGAIGAFTIAEDSQVQGDPASLGPEGYRIDFGNSYIQVVTWDNEGVHTQGFLTYSESTDPASPHFADFTEAYSQKQWQPLAFRADEIAQQQISEVTLTGTATRTGR